MVGFRDFLLNGIKQYHPTIWGPRSYDLVEKFAQIHLTYIFSFENLPSPQGEKDSDHHLLRWTNSPIMDGLKKKRSSYFGWKGHLPVPTYPHEPNKHVFQAMKSSFFLDHWRLLHDFLRDFFPGRRRRMHLTGSRIWHLSKGLSWWWFRGKKDSMIL